MALTPEELRDMRDELRALRLAQAQQGLRIERLATALERVRPEGGVPLARLPTSPAGPPPHWVAGSARPAGGAPPAPDAGEHDVPTRRSGAGGGGVPTGGPGAPPRRNRLEAVVSQSLLPLIGVAILLLGVGIGVRWAVDNDYIGPVARVTMGFVTGAVMLGFAERLRAKYDTLSAALVGGGMAVLYFVTYAANSYYALIPTGAAFAMMAAFTVFTVGAAVRYDRQLVAHLGLVGAYAVPFLLSSGGGDWRLMLAYVTLLNVGVLAVSYFRTWRALAYVTLGLTYLVFGALLADGIVGAERAGGIAEIAVLAFVTANAVLLLGALVAREFREEEASTLAEATGMLVNGLLYFGIGYLLIDEDHGGWLGVFALANAAVYLALGLALRRRSGPATDGRVVPLLAVLGLAFVAVAVPAQLDGPTVTVLWAGLAAGLYYAAARIALPTLRWGGYGLLALATLSLADDLYARPSDAAVVFNVYLPAILAVAAAAAAVAYLALRDVRERQRHRVGGYVASALSIGLVFLAGEQEIAAYWQVPGIIRDFDATYGDYAPYDIYGPTWLYGHARDFWTAVYALAFSIVLFAADALRRRQKGAFGSLREGAPGVTGAPTESAKRAPDALVATALVLVGVGAFLSAGLYAHSELRDAYLATVGQPLEYGFGARTWWRYVGIALTVLATAALYFRLRHAGLVPAVRRALELGLHIVALWLLSSELIHQLQLFGSEVPYRLGITILWGAYAILLIGLGLLWRRAHLRAASMAVFAATLAKLFLYDLADLSTISKTIVLVVLGVLILLSSFLYTRFRDRIVPHDEE